MLVYLLGIMYATIIVLQTTASVFVIGILSVLAWIGYAMLTEPLQEINVSEGDDLHSETINPKQNHGTYRPMHSTIVNVEIGEGTIVRDHVNLYHCRIGRDCKIESFVYIEEGVTIGDNCKIKPHVFIPTGVTIEDDVFVGPNVTFTNDKYPRTRGEWTLLKTVVERGVSIGANSVILPGVTIGKEAVVGAGSVVTEDVSPGTVVGGNPARPLQK